MTDAVQDSQGNYYVSEYGEFDRIQKYSRDGKLDQGMGRARPRARASSCGRNRGHRRAGSDLGGRLVQPPHPDFRHRRQPRPHVGQCRSEPGELYYPYSIVLDGEGHVYVVEYGNHRVQKFTLDGESLGCWGESGREPGSAIQPLGNRTVQRRPPVRARHQQPPRARNTTLGSSAMQRPAPAGNLHSECGLTSFGLHPSFQM